ncbi:hypothetical protein SADUNF_Sadunf10G0057200 [Salix dunnii]|uniref:Uncharacterized protein n=1 Tax=Salix dunnii TaxID=1413687 RepID=A0A835JM33_9ROSI|nr:hypothetical protein SADUNF_Sadunf10G0057200 [Salix dunnii]
MAYNSTCITSVAILFLLQPLIARSGFIPPLRSSIFEDVCKKVECGKGACKPSDNSTWFFECECDPGWKQISSGDHKFLPCIVPNCTLNFSCMPAPSPVQDKASKDNESIFDRAIGMDCQNLGISVSNKSTSPTPVMVDSVTGTPKRPVKVIDCESMNSDSSILQEKFHWLMTLIVLLSMIDWVEN